MAATNASKAKKSGYQKLMEGASKSEYIDTAKANSDENTPSTPSTPSAPAKVNPIVERATPSTRPLVVMPQQAGMASGTANLLNLKTGRTVPMDAVVAAKMAKRYPNEFKILD